MAYTAPFTTLLAQAASQGGYFTTQQARAAGYGYDDQHYHVRQGHWDRVARGLYRLRGFPTPAQWDLIELSLLSADRTGTPQAVFSHETALVLHELTDINPAALHATVPPGFRKRLPPGILLTHAHLTEQDWEQREGYRVTTPLRTLLDIASSPQYWPFLKDAIHQALARGLVRRKQLEQASGSTRMRARLRAALRAIDREPPIRPKGAY
jgi:predicted transcriptional regulator of viral defense system